MIRRILEAMSDERREAQPFATWLILAGIVNFGAFCGLFLAWSWLAPLRSAVIAPGFVSVDTYRKKLQHLEGGIVGDILVREGDQVQSGQLLVRMRDVAQAATVARLQSQYFESLAIAAQSVAERDGHDKISFPAELAESTEQAAKSAMTAQRNVFESQLDLFKRTQSVMRQKVLQSQEQERGLRGQLAALDSQLKHFAAEIADAQQLYKQQLLARSRFLKLNRENEERRGEHSKVSGLIAQVQQQILELELKMTEMKVARIAGAVDRLRENQAKAFEYSQLLVAARDVMKRTELRSPIDGTIVDMQVHTLDGVVAAGQTLMEIVPKADLLIVEGRLRPEDREEVRAGLEAYVQLTTQGRRDPRPIKGRLEGISADRLVDKESSLPYYRVRVHLDPGHVNQQAVKVMAGMGAEVFIQTGERTPLEYLISPVIRALNRGMREQ